MINPRASCHPVSLLYYDVDNLHTLKYTIILPVVSTQSIWKKGSEARYDKAILGEKTRLLQRAELETSETAAN